MMSGLVVYCRSLAYGLVLNILLPYTVNIHGKSVISYYSRYNVKSNIPEEGYGY